MKDYRTIKEIVEQLSKCNYECEGGYLNNNIAFIRLKEISELSYQPKFQVNEPVMYKGVKYYVRAVRSMDCSHPNPELEYDLSIQQNRACTTNKTDLHNIREKDLITCNDFEFNEIENAKRLLISKGIKFN